ncbi:MAG: hypothetical protein AVDCRST_MAG22-508 [uncultured Rubrobacteraceae bacterium]|uniref:Uncharacterized protein n=1 Tax=uncultured Rubrobacteraceae bacterium TaxID=349277 RepID=A0A6J4NQM4_9ACTN|nr:MAG: hypothetical protein AVDCRST_MAG22-508 [uncultured Rubrobacteraceae bacterium]
MGDVRTRFRPFEAGVALLGGASLAAVGPLREALATLPGVTVAAALILLLTPGLLLSRWFLNGYFSGVALVPAGFVLGFGAFALLAVPMLILDASLDAYLWAAGSLVAVSLLAAAVVAFAGSRPGDEAEPLVSDGGGVMWAPFVLLVGALAFIARITAPSSYGDIWVYLAWVRAYLGQGGLGAAEPFFGGEVGLSRAKINGWLVEQAALSKVSGADPIDFVFSYLNPVLVVVALLAFYALARVLLKSERAALFCGCLYALFFLVHLGQSRFTFGGEFVQRLPEDKLATKFLFLPLALAFAAAFLDGGGKRYFGCFAFMLCAVLTIHPIGFAIIGLSMAGFGILHLASNPRSRSSWTRVSAMGLTGVVVMVLPAVLIPTFTGRPLTDVLADSDINSGDPDVLRNMVFVSPERARIFEFADGSYMMHPSLLLDPLLAVAFLLGVPFLLLRVERSLAAQLLLGTMLLTTFAVYVPPITTFLGDELVLPGQIWRLAWPIPLASLLAFGWLAWTALGWAADRVNLLRPVLPTLVVAVLAAVAVPWVSDGMKPIMDHKESSRKAGFYPVDPLYPWFRDEVTSSKVVLASDLLGARIPAYSSEANVVSRRGGLVLRARPRLEERVPGQIEAPQGAVDVQKFFSGTTFRKGAEILRRHDVDLVMVTAGSSLEAALRRLPGFEPVEEPSDRYNLYSVDLRKLGTTPSA